MNEPRSKVTPMRRVHRVQLGDTLAHLAKKYYGDELLAHALATVNGISPSAILPVGTTVKIPRRSEIQTSAPALGDASSDPVYSGPPLDTITVKATRPWYSNPWLLASGALLAYLIFIESET